MKRHTTVALVATALAVAAVIPADEKSQDHRPRIDRTQSDGGVFYAPVTLRNAVFRFFERRNSLHCWSGLMDYEFDVKPDGHLSQFRLILRDRPEQLLVGEPGEQGFRPLFKQSVYWDLDGDTVLDAMSKNGEGYILLGNSWVRAGGSKIGYKPGRPVYSRDTKTKYVFSEGAWKPTPQ
ncbi:MAG: hypothetical protein JXQ73_07860 [Phycisphaerae bacterium]|nr:hypothetical protein [Phycisphaerae bacterium]